MPVFQENNASNNSIERFNYNNHAEDGFNEEDQYQNMGFQSQILMKSYNIPYERSQKDTNSNNSSKLLKNSSASYSPLISSINTTPSQVGHNQYNLNCTDQLLTNYYPLSLSQTSSQLSLLSRSSQVQQHHLQNHKHHSSQLTATLPSSSQYSFSRLSKNPKNKLFQTLHQLNFPDILHEKAKPLAIPQFTSETIKQKMLTTSPSFHKEFYLSQNHCLRPSKYNTKKYKQAESCHSEIDSLLLFPQLTKKLPTEPSQYKHGCIIQTEPNNINESSFHQQKPKQLLYVTRSTYMH